MFEVLRSMYSSVKAVVKENGSVMTEDVIEQMVGLRQGCILSPCLFSLFIADLPRDLEGAGTTGVKLYDVWIRILLYADDGALLAASVSDLQAML